MQPDVQYHLKWFATAEWWALPHPTSVTAASTCPAHCFGGQIAHVTLLPALAIMWLQVLLEVSALRYKYKSLFDTLPFPVITEAERRAAQEVRARKLSELAAERQAAMHAHMSASSSKRPGDPLALESAGAIDDTDAATASAATAGSSSGSNQAAYGSAPSLGASSSGSCTSVDSQCSGQDTTSPTACDGAAGAAKSLSDSSAW
jgi:hypothetical protein